MKKNDIFAMKADHLGADMEGICHHEGMAVFVPGLLPGEETDVRIVKTEKRFAFGRMEHAPNIPSPDRVLPDCGVFPRCGGCSCRHMTYSASLEAKRLHVRDCFERIGKIRLDVPPVIGMNMPSAYRNKTALPVGGTSDQPELGFFAPRSHTLIPAISCPNALPPAGSIAAAFQKWMRSYHIAPYQEEMHSGIIRHLVIRVNRRGEAMVTIVINASSLPHTAELWKVIEPLGTVSLYLNINRAKSNVILSNSFILLYGSETLSDTLCGLHFRLSPASFFQVNPLQTERLYETALSFAALTPQDSLCDVYCGAGTITLMMASHCAHATGIEIVPDAILNAKENAVRNRINNVSFLAGKAEVLLPQMVSDGLRPDVIIVDPPRKGLDPEVIEAIAEASPSRLVYISCNAATQARDAALLYAHGYTIRKIQPVDMFPFTSHVETVALLINQNAKAKRHMRIGIDAEDYNRIKDSEKKADE